MSILQAPVRQIAWLVNSIARTSTCGQRLFEILDLEPDIRDREGAPALDVREGTLRFENVSFSYHDRGGDRRGHRAEDHAAARTADRACDRPEDRAGGRTDHGAGDRPGARAGGRTADRAGHGPQGHAGGDTDDRAGDQPDHRAPGHESGRVHARAGYEAGVGHDPDAPPTLQDVSFELRRGRTLGLVGPPGSGKSTIAHLIPRFYDVTAGRITIDGQDIRDVTLESLRGFVSVVQQDAYLFTAPVDANVAYGDPWADRSAIRQASESAQLHQYIAHLPEEYRTLVGERGVSLSGGQRQRLAIARAVLPHSGLIVFDDSTAAVDAGTERAIHEALADLTRERATIVIAHRLSSLMHADEILYLEHGRVLERGTHDELVALGGHYAALHALQTTTPQSTP